MTTTNQTSTRKNTSNTINRFMYGAFVAMSIYYLLVNHDCGMAMTNLGVALVFDPFDQRVVWNQRPVYQRVWLVAHLVAVLALFLFLLFPLLRTS